MEIELNKENFEKIPNEWLTSEIDLKQVAKKYSSNSKKVGKEGNLPFGRLNHEWVHLKSLMKKNDTIWEFDSPADHWDSLCGRSGIALVCEGKIVFTIVTVMN
tara:strand:- start:826 stop:1134 length:309 start_codon:yes stop_codon:yes gene_type:complete